MNKLKTNKNNRSILIWLLAGIGVLTIAIFLYLSSRKSTDFEPLIKDKLAQLVTKASDGLYILKMESIEIDILNSSIIASNVSLIPDTARMLELEKQSALPNDIFSASLKSLRITGIAATDFINKKDISLNEIIMDAPEILITHKKRKYNKVDTASIYNKIASDNESYSLKLLSMNNIQLTHKNLDKNNKVSKLKNLTAVLKDIQIDSSTANDTSRFLFANEALMYLKNYSTVTADKLYNFSIDSIALNPQAGTMLAKNIRLKPIGNKDQFSAKLKFLQDRFDILFEEGRFENIDWWLLIGNDAIIADNMQIKNGFINVYTDRSLPKSGKSKVGNYPHQMLKKIETPISIKYMAIKNVNVSYEELNPKSGKTGKVTFDNTNGDIWNITNMPEQIAKEKTMKVKANTRFMNDGMLDVVFNFNLANTKQGIFSVDATMDAMNGKNLNSVTEELALVRVEELQIDKLKVHIDGSNTKANGTVLFAYHDLKITVLKEVDDEEKKVKKKGLVSFIANSFVINKANPKAGKPVKQFDIALERNIETSFFNLVWQCVKDGAIQTVK